MSIKIYNGLIAETPDVFELADEVREVIHAETMRQLVTVYQTLLADKQPGKFWGNYPDFFYLDLEVKEPIEWGTLALELPRKISKINRHPLRTGSKADLLCTVAILPNRNGYRPLLMTFGEHSSHYRQALIEACVAADYHYQNQTERPDGVTEASWQDRRESWHDLIEADLTPSEAGLMIEPPSPFAMSQHLMAWQQDHPEEMSNA